MVDETYDTIPKSRTQICLRTLESMPSILYSVSNNVQLHIRRAIEYISYFPRVIISDKTEFRSFRMPFEEENFFGCTKKNLCLTSFFI